MNVCRLVSQLLQSFVVSYMVMLCVRLAFFPDVGLGPESKLLLVTLLVLGLTLFLPLWGMNSRRVIANLVWVSVIIGITLPLTAWQVGSTVQWALPLIGILGALAIVLLERSPLPSPSRQRRLFELDAWQWVAALGFLALLCLAAMTIWFGAGQQAPDANALIRLLVAACAVPLVWAKRVSGIRRGEDPVRNLEKCAAWLMLWLMTSNVVLAFNFEWLNAHSQNQMPVASAAGVMAALFAFGFAVKLAPIRRWLPVATVVFAIAWSMAAARTFPQIMVSMLPVSGLVIGLFLPVKRHWLAMLLWLVVLTSPAIVLGLLHHALVMHGLVGSLVFGMTRWLNQNSGAYSVVADRPDVVQAPGNSFLAETAGNRFGIATALVALVLGSGWLYTLRLEDHESLRAGAKRRAEELVHLIEQSLQDAEHMAEAMRPELLPAISSQQAFAAELGELQRLAGKGIVLEWAPKGIIKYIHPLPGNESAIGHNLLTDPGRAAMIRKIIETGKPEWTGPIPLVQGGFGMLYQTPVYRNSAAKTTRSFVGVAQSLVKLPLAVEAFIQSQDRYMYRVRIGVGKVEPVLVLNQWPAVAVEADDDLIAGHARHTPHHDQDHPHWGIRPTSEHPLTSQITIEVSAMPHLDANASKVPARLQIMLIIAFLLGWLVRTLTRQQMRVSALAQHENELSQMREILSQDLTGKLLFGVDGQVIWMNEAASPTLNAPPEKLAGFNCFTNPVFCARGWDALARATLADGYPRGFENREGGAFGQKLDVKVTLFRVTIGGQHHLLSQVLDLTEIHAAQQALEDSEERFRHFMDNSPTIAWLKDESGRYVYFNKTYERLVAGADRALWLGKTDADLFHAEVAAEFRNNDLAVLQSGQAATVVESTVDRNGVTRFWLNNTFSFANDKGQRFIAGIGLDITERKQLEDELSDSWMFVQRILDSLPNHIAVIDADGTIIAVNEAWRKFAHENGNGQGEMMPTGTDVGGNYLTVCNDSSGEERSTALHVADGIRKVLDGKLACFKLEYPCASPECERWYSLDFVPIDGESKGVAIHTDITLRKLAETTLRTQTAKLNAILENSAVGIALVRDRKIVWGNLKLATLLKLSAEALPGYSLSQCYATPEDYDRFGRECYPVLASGTPYIVEMPIMAADETIFWARISGQAINPDAPLDASIWVVEDISERKQMEQRSRQMLDIFEASPDFVGIASTDGKAVYLNPAGRALIGMSKEADITSMDIGEFFPDWANKLNQEEIIPYIFSHGQWHGNLALRHRDGHEIPVSHIGTLHRGLDGQSSFLSAIMRDSRPEMERQRVLLVAKENAEAASQAKSDFLSNMSHEIRTPLNGVLGLLQLLEGTALDPRQADYVHRAYRTSRILLNIINDILDISRIEAGRIDILPQPFSLREAVESVVDTLRDVAARKQLTLATQFDSSCPTWFEGDVLRIQQVLMNLGSNAIKFTEQGRVDFRISCTFQSAQSVVVRFEVQDTGIGISHSQCERIFERFIQAESGNSRRFSGTGLGLAIAKGLVDAMGGTIGVNSSPGHGSCFWFVLMLPVVDASASASASASAQNLAGLRILVVEDQELNQIVLMNMLEKLGAHAVLAKDGSEAIAQVLASNGSAIVSREPTDELPFDVVLMDIQMPVLDGISATKILREVHRIADLPIIAITAGVESKDREKCLASGMNDFLAKPVEIANLRRIIQRHCKCNEPAAHPARLAQVVAALESPPGFALAEAIDHLGGDLTIFIRLLKRFLESLDVTQKVLRDVLQDSSHEATQQAMRQLHALRSSALTLGAIELADITREIESSLAEGKPVDRISILATLTSTLNLARKVFLECIDRYQQPDQSRNKGVDS